MDARLVQVGSGILFVIELSLRIPLALAMGICQVIEKTLMDEFEKFCEDTGRTKTKAVEMAIREFLDSHNKNNK